MRRAPPDGFEGRQREAFQGREGASVDLEAGEGLHGGVVDDVGGAVQAVQDVGERFGPAAGHQQGADGVAAATARRITFSPSATKRPCSASRLLRRFTSRSRT